MKHYNDGGVAAYDRLQEIFATITSGVTGWYWLQAAQR